MTHLVEVVHLLDKELIPRRNRERIPITFRESQSDDDAITQIEKLLVPVFKLDSYQVLIKHLAIIWNYPSSYQLIRKLVKNIGNLVKKYLKETTSDMNEILFSNGVIKESEKMQRMFYIDLGFLNSWIENREIFYEVNQESNPLTYTRNAEEEKITINQVFPQYGDVESSIEMSHSFFNTLNEYSKLNYYKELPNAFRFLPNSKLSFSEREMILKENDYTNISLEEDDGNKEKSLKKRVGKARKYVTDFDPNSIDLKDSVIPGQGYIQEFNVSHICKVPSYYTSNNHLGSSSTLNLKKTLSNSLLNENTKLSKNVQQLVYNDGDSLSYLKYFYSGNYRGPGSGNYKDNNLINKVNKIATTSRVLKSNHRITKDFNRAFKRRALQNIKGLTYDVFNKNLVHATLSDTQVNDFRNLEMLHNNLQFNVLINTYRLVADYTWRKYFEFKLTDFEQMRNIKNNKEIPLLKKFTMPDEHKEIVNSLPIELRDEEVNDEQHNQRLPSIKKPIYYTCAVEDLTNPQVLNKIDIIKFPNSNSVGWDNLRKFKRD